MKNKDVEQYLSRLEEPSKKLLYSTILIIQELVPSAEIYLSYGMPCFKYKGKYLIGVGAFKHHLSIFPGGEVVEVLKDDLKNYKTSKGTIQFQEDNPLHTTVLKKILELRVRNILNL